MSKPANWPDGVPYIDTSVGHVGVSHLRQMNATLDRKAKRKPESTSGVRDRGEK